MAREFVDAGTDPLVHEEVKGANMPGRRPCSRTEPSYMQTCMVTISITLEAYEAVSATLPDGYVAQPPQIDERGGVRFIVDHKTLDRLTALRGPGDSYSDVILRRANRRSVI